MGEGTGIEAEAGMDGMLEGSCRTLLAGGANEVEFTRND